MLPQLNPPVHQILAGISPTPSPQATGTVPGVGVGALGGSTYSQGLVAPAFLRVCACAIDSVSLETPTHTDRWGARLVVVPVRR